MIPLRVLIVDDNRDGADSLGLLVEELDHHTHVTYGGAQALEVATVFRPDVMFVDLAMPGLDGCSLVKRFRQMLAFTRTTIVAITGHADEGHRTLALSAGCDAVLFKPITPTHILETLASVIRVAADVDHSFLIARRRLPIGEARRIRSERKSRTLTESESEGAISEGIIRFQEEYLGWRSEEIRVHFVNNVLLVRITGTLTLAERQLSKSASAERGRDLIKQGRKQLLELARPMLESLIHEVTGVKALSMHHDISTVTGEEVIAFSLVEPVGFE